MRWNRSTTIGAAAFMLLGVMACGNDERPEAATTSVAGVISQYEENDAIAARVAAGWNGEAPMMAVYKTPQCGCCSAWIDHVEKAGFRTEVLDMQDLSPIKAQYGVPRELLSCHTSVVGGYVIEGHVPADAIARLLRERPDIAGIAVRGMPMGSPGMEGPFRDEYDIVAMGHDGARSVFESRR
jgi:hypothetical protein